MNNTTPRAKILIVDDDPTLLSLLSDTLGAIGYQIVKAETGAKALEVLQESVFDLMITDIKMPDIDGLQLFRKVRRQFSQMPVLFITGVASHEIMESAEADGFLSKPFRISKIEELIQQALKNKALGTQDRPPHVLIIDQDHNFLEDLSETLSLTDYLPFKASSIKTAQQQLSDGIFDVVIVEESLITSDSQISSEMLNENYPDLALIITADNQNNLDLRKSEFSESKILGVLKKPFKVSEVLSLLSGVSFTD